MFNLDQLPPTMEVFQDSEFGPTISLEIIAHPFLKASALPHPPLPGTLNSHCLYWYLTSNGEKIGEFKEQAIGSVIWEDSEGKEVIDAFLGRFCGPAANDEGEGESRPPPPADHQESPKLVINRKSTIAPPPAY